MNPVSADLALYTVSHYVCARCWHLLIITHHEGQDWVECSNSAHCDGQGYVTARYAARRLDESHSELNEARENIGYILPVQPKRSEKQLLSDLGF